MSRNIQFRRAERDKHIHKKTFILKYCWKLDEDYINSISSRLDKQKVHCSCPMCQIKSKEELKISDKKKLEKMNYDLEMSLW